MNLSSPHTHCFIILFYLFTINTYCYVDPKFQACPPKTCANNNQTISYPFYIQGTQEAFCGYPGFGIHCASNGFPILNLSNTQYIIHQIFYQNQSLRVSNAAFSTLQSNIAKVCLPSTQNITLPIDDQFNFAPNQKDLILFYGCDSLPSLEEHRVGCYAENETSSVLALYKEDDKNISFVSKNCTGEVVDTVVEDGNGGIREALSKGFLLTWTASDCTECYGTGGRCGFDSDLHKFRCYCTDRVHAAKCGPDPDKTDTKMMSVVATVSALVGVGIVVFVVWTCWFRRKKFPSSFLFWRENPTHRIIEEFLEHHGPLPSARYSYSQVKKMTNSFRNKLGEGGFGSVYKGKLCDGRAVAVKILSKSKDNGEEFINEVASISRTSHVNIVRLLGFCLESSKRALIYEFMPNGSLDKFIYEDKSPLHVEQQLHCKILYDITIGIARGLDYLHRGCNTRILHFDIKPHNILLDEDFCPRISDFGLAKICPRKESVVSLTDARGTVGYIAPEVFSRNFGAVSHKSDVYSYGMMVLEMVGMRNNIKAEVDSEIYFPHWIHYRLESTQDLGSQIIRNETDDKMMRKMAIVGLWCIQIHPSSRPAISRVVEMLESEVELLQIPPRSFTSSPSTSAAHLSFETL